MSILTDWMTDWLQYHENIVEMWNLGRLKNLDFSGLLVIINKERQRCRPGRWWASRRPLWASVRPPLVRYRWNRRQRRGYPCGTEKCSESIRTWQSFQSIVKTFFLIDKKVLFRRDGSLISQNGTFHQLVKVYWETFCRWFWYVYRKTLDFSGYHQRNAWLFPH